MFQGHLFPAHCLVVGLCMLESDTNYEYSRLLLRATLLHSFSRAVMPDFPIGTLFRQYIVSGYWPLGQSQEWVTAHVVELKSHQIVVGYYHSLYALVVPV